MKSVKVFHLVILAFVGIALYSHTLRGSFVFDDHNAIVKSNLIRGPLEISQYWKHNPARFLTDLSFGLNFFYSGYDTFFFRLVNLGFHIVSSIIVYLLLEFLIAYGEKKSKGKSSLLPFFGSLIFLVHPVQTQAVAYISQRYALMSGAFFLAALYLYLRARNGGSFVLYISSVLYALFAFLSKENSFTLLPVLVLSEIYFKRKSRLIERVSALSPYFIIGALIIFMAYLSPWKNSGSINIVSSLSSISMKHDEDISRHSYFLTQGNVLLSYMRLLILPVNQNADYDYPIVRVPDIRTGASFILILITLFWAVLNRNKNRLISFGVLFFFTALSVESSIIPIKDVIQEHRLYLPMFGYALIVCSLVRGAVKERKTVISKNILVIVGSVYVLLLGSVSYLRGTVWTSEKLLWEDVVGKSPNKARGHYNFGYVLYFYKEKERALHEFEKAISLKPDFKEAYLNAGAIYEQIGDLKKAEEYYLKSLEIDPKYKGGFFQLAGMYILTGRKGEGIKLYEKILEQDPGNIQVKELLGKLSE